jgi:hypothetical protein
MSAARNSESGIVPNIRASVPAARKSRRPPSLVRPRLRKAAGTCSPNRSTSSATVTPCSPPGRGFRPRASHAMIASTCRRRASGVPNGPQ